MAVDTHHTFCCPAVIRHSSNVEHVDIRGKFWPHIHGAVSAAVSTGT